MLRDKQCKASNITTGSGFLLLEFSQDRNMQLLHFFLFLILYVFTAAGNLLIIGTIILDHHLHTPMYFFLMNLAIQDFGSVSVIIPKSLANSLMNTRYISYSGCVAQFLLFIFFFASNFYLLTVMAYDRYVAICNPLQYEMVMNRKACFKMILCVWITGLLYAILNTSSTFATPFCSNVVDQFFCEIPQLLKLACSDLYLVEIGVLVLSSIIGLTFFVFVVVTYVHIFKAVLRFPVQGRRKAFSTCFPHLIVFCTLVFTGLCVYLGSASNIPSNLRLTISLIYTMVPPMMNPVIYSMRNKEIKKAMLKLLGSLPVASLVKGGGGGPPQVPS